MISRYNYYNNNNNNNNYYYYYYYYYYNYCSRQLTLGADRDSVCLCWILLFSWDAGMRLRLEQKGSYLLIAL